MLCTVLIVTALAAEPVDYIALIEAEIGDDGATLTFSDRPFDETTIRKRALGEMGSWSDADEVATLGEVSKWTDTTSAPGERWEYKVTRTTGSLTATGYIAVAHEAQEIDGRGRVALVIDEAVADALEDSLDQLAWDLVGDGWTVVEHWVGSDEAPEDIRAVLQAEDGLEAAILIGHVPVPYSGELNPDGHTDHIGAWPADTYYADLDGTWTDWLVTNTSAAREANHNVPYDGKWDQSSTPSELELQVGRIDMFDLPAFEDDEITLLQRYFERNHAWRHAEIEAEIAVVIDDNFGTYAAGAFSGWLLSPVVGRASLEEGDFLTTLTEQPYLFGYGSGAGSYTAANGVVTTADFAEETLQGVFLMIFGSYHGDWDSSDNLLRAALAADGNALTCVWGGRPVHQHHALGAGETVGFAVRATQNSPENIASLDNNALGVHTALLGDPTLRAFPVSPPGELTAVAADDRGTIELSWVASDAPDLLGYHVYRSDVAMGPYTRMTDTPLSETTTLDALETEGQWWWMVRAITRQETSSGVFANPSQGQFAELEVTCADGLCGEVDEEPTGCSCSKTGGAQGIGALVFALIATGRRRRTNRPKMLGTGPT